MYVKRNLRHTAMHLSERNLRKLLEVFERDGQAALVRDGADGTVAVIVESDDLHYASRARRADAIA